MSFANLFRHKSLEVPLALAALVMIGAAVPAAALIDDARAAALAANLDALSAGQNVPLATDTAQMLVDPSATDADWASYFAVYFQNRLFTPQLLEFFRFAVTQLPGAAPRPAFVAATAAGAAAAPMLAGIAETGRPADFSSLLYSLNTLQAMLPAAPVEARGPLFALMTRGIEGRTLDLTAVLQPGPEGSAPTAMLGMQICLTLAAYAGPGSQRAAVTTMLRLPDRVRTFWQSTGVFLFDNGALSDAQAASLDSLLRSFPENLHEIVALLAAEAYGLDPSLPQLIVSGQIVPVPLIAMDAATNPAEFVVLGPSPVSPDFTATAGANVFRAVQAVQFARRPHLALRRDAILARSGARDVSYLRRGVPPEMFLENPAEFLPMTAYLWIINSDTAWRMALDFFRLEQPAPAESLLLIADVLSNGTDASLAFATNPEGIVSSAPTQIGRALIEDIAAEEPASPTGVAFLPNPQANAIRMLGEVWEFSLGPTGQLTRLFREMGSLPL